MWLDIVLCVGNFMMGLIIGIFIGFLGRQGG